LPLGRSIPVLVGIVKNLVARKARQRGEKEKRKSNPGI